MPPLNGIGGTPEVWYNTSTSQAYIVYFVPNSHPPIPLLYTATEEDIQAAFGPNKTVTYDRRLTASQLRQTGGLVWGDRDELANTTEDPFDTWANEVEAQAAVRPWLRDEEVLGLIASAALEGRELAPAEWEQTEWFRSRSHAEQQWALLYESSPETARDQRQDARLTIQAQAGQLGIDGQNRVFNYIADRWVTGEWTEAYALNQLTRLLGRTKNLDPELARFIRTNDLDTEPGANLTSQVEALSQEWLGPYFGSLNDKQIRRWSHVLASDPQGEARFVQHLQERRQALFPEYTSPTATYEDIAGPWRQRWAQIWGENPDEADPLFTKAIRMNDAVEFDKLLRHQGLARGNEQVTRDMIIGMGESFGTGVIENPYA